VTRTSCLDAFNSAKEPVRKGPQTPNTARARREETKDHDLEAQEHDSREPDSRDARPSNPSNESENQRLQGLPGNHVRPDLTETV
jgi:hypothetical protein